MSIDRNLLAPYVVSVLEKSGWNENRKIDISAWKAVLADEGYSIFSYAEEILENFGGIEIKIPLCTQHLKTSLFRAFREMKRRDSGI